MEVTGANPFLMMEEEHKSPQSSFNPFLMEDTSAMAAPQVTTDNPFFFTSTEPTTTSMANNPFAFDAMDYAPTTTSSTANDLFGTGFDEPIFSSSNTVNISAAPTNLTNTSDLLGASDFLTDTPPKQPDIQPTLIKPSELDLKNSANASVVKTDLNNVNDKTKKPQRPPPPRAAVPPSKETQDLILSVTGAMDATSSHLLDRIPPTRTPSPVSMRDLHSPSPTPDLFSNDLVDVENSSETVPKKEIDFFDLSDEPISSTPATTTVTSTTVSEPMLLMKDSDPFENTIKKTENIETTKIAGDPFSSLINTSNTVTNTFCDINQNQTTIKQPSRPPPPQKPPPPQVPRPPQIKPATTSIINSHTTVSSTPPPKPPPPKPAPPKPILPTFSPTSQTTPFQSTTASIITTSTTSVVTTSVVSAPSLVSTAATTPTLVSITSAASSENVAKTFTPAFSSATIPSATEATSTISQNTSAIKISPTKPFAETKPVTDIFAEPINSSMGITSPTNKPLAEIKQPTDIFAEPIASTDTTPSTKPPEEQSMFDQDIPSEKKISPSKQEDNSAKNPFSFGEETKLIDTLSNTQADTSTQLLDDFMGSTTTTTTTTTAINNNTILQSSNIFDSQPQQLETKTGGFNDLFGSSEPTNDILDVFESKPPPSSAPVDIPKQSILEKFQKQSEDFDAFAAKFESAKENATNDAFDPFSGGSTKTVKAADASSAWGDTLISTEKVDVSSGFGTEEPFDSFLSLSEPPPAPQCTPARITKGESDSDEDKDFAVFIKPKNLDLTEGRVHEEGIVPTLAPPPKSPVQSSVSDTSPRFNPFDQQQEFAAISESGGILPSESAHLERTDSQETPPTPLYDEDTSQPLEPFPRTTYAGEGWEMQLRQPNKKKITGQRFWKKIFLKLVYQGDNPVLQLFNAQTDKDPFQELPLQACYSVSEIGAQQYDQFGKIFTVKLQYVFYKERPGVRPGQVSKAERISNKLSQFAAYAIQGDYQGVKEFGSDLKKLGLPVEHAPQISQLFKIGSQNYEHMKEFSCAVEEALFRLTVHRDRALHYKMEEVQITVVDELYVEQNAEGGVDKQIARVRLFFLGFLSGMPDIELGINDMRRQGKEVVGRHDIIPVVTEEWIRLENCEFHACVQQEEYHKTHIIRFKPPDACYIELMRFRVRPPKNRELPLQLKATMCVTGNKVELRADVLVPGFASRKLGQVPCEDVMIRFPIPECWIYLFRVEKHFRYGSVKSAHRRTGKIKGIERFLGAVETLQESLIEVTSGQAKYEHQHRSIVWRCPRLPKEGQGAYTTHNLVCRMALTSFDQIPEQLAEYCYVEFTMPATQVSHTTVRSVSVQGSDSDEPPEKYVRYLARHEYRVGIEHTRGESPPAYLAATIVRPSAPETNSATPTPTVAESSDSDSD